MERPQSKDKALNAYVDYIEAELNKFKENAYLPSYVSMKMIVDSINNQIQKIQINITSDEGDKEFKTISKYASQLLEYSKQLDAFRSKLSPEEIVLGDKKVKEITKEGGVEEYLKSKS